MELKNEALAVPFSDFGYQLYLTRLYSQILLVINMVISIAF